MLLRGAGVRKGLAVSSGKNIKLLRTVAGIQTQKAFAELLGVRRGVDRGAVHRSGGVRLAGRGSGSGSAFPLRGLGRSYGTGLPATDPPRRSFAVGGRRGVRAAAGSARRWRPRWNVALRQRELFGAAEYPDRHVGSDDRDDVDVG